MTVIEDFKLILDNEALLEYEIHYFKQHPKAKKKPIENPWHPSINQWMIMKRPMMNALKQKWREFIVWFMDTKGLSNMEISACEMTFTVYYKTKIRHDTDNSVPKFILDGMVDCRFLVDDDSTHLRTLTLKCSTDKEHPRTEILIHNIKTEGDK